MSLVTLTFDNGPTLETTPTVLQHLQARGLSAYFCVVGSQLEGSNEQVDLARETLFRGHQLVNHSLTHGVALGDDPTHAHAIREVTNMHSLLVEKLGDWGDLWFRPFGRGGELGKHILSKPAVGELQALSYSLLLWNCVPRDWLDSTGWVDTALREIEAQDHTVVVLHDLDTGAMEHLPRFLDTLQERNYEITLTLPDECVPMRTGEQTWAQADFNKLVYAEH